MSNDLIRDYGLKPYTRLNQKLPHCADEAWQLVCELPHNAQFQHWIELDAPAGKTLSFHSSNPMAKWMQPDQTYATVEGTQCHEVPGWVSGEGAIYHVPAGVTVRAVQYRETGYDTDFAGTFACNDEDYDILFQKASRTCYLCMRDHFMDCPDRERTPLCLGDVCIQMEEIFYAFDTRSHELARQAIANNPDYTHIIDQNLMFAGEYGTWFYYLNTGDLETIRAQYPNLKAYLAKWKLRDDGVIEHNTDGWDWCDWGSPSRDSEVVQCCQYYSTLAAFRKMALATGHDDDLPAIDEVLGSIEANFDAVYWQGKWYQSGEVDYPDERANAMAVITGLASPDKWDSIFEHVLSQKLCPEWEEGSTYNASSYFERWIMEALCRMGREDFALLRMAERYRDQIDCRTTTLWEHFGRWWKTHFDPNSTLNHGWNSPNTILSRYIAGVEPTAPGWTAFQVCPKESFLRDLAVGLETVKGRVEVTIAKTTSTYTLTLAAPEGMNGVVGIPRKAFTRIDSVEANGTTVWQPAGAPAADDVHFAGEREGYLLFAVESGEWTFAAHGELTLRDVKPPRLPARGGTRLDASLWRATASHVHQGPTLVYTYGEKDGGSAMDAIDGDVWTSWSTGAPQEPGQWFQLDLGQPARFDRIVLENGWAPYDSPREYAVHVSNDGEAWGEPVATGQGTFAITRIATPGQEARYVRIENRGSSTYWWSIFEIDLFRD